MEDNSLVAAAAGGDQWAFEELVTRYRTHIYRTAYRTVLSEDDALDVTQTVFERLVHKIGSFNGSGSFRSWVTTIAVREAINYHRRPSRRESSTEPEALASIQEQHQNTRETPRSRLENAERLKLVQQAMARLSPQQRAIFTLRLQEDMGPKEISERLGIPAGQVRNQLWNAINKVRKLVSW